MADPPFPPEAIAQAVRDLEKAADHGNRRGFRGRGPWTGVAWDIETGHEVGDCGHRHKVSTDEARNCPGLDRFDTIEVVTVRSDQLAQLLAALEASERERERLREAAERVTDDFLDLNALLRRHGIADQVMLAGMAQLAAALTPSTPPDLREDTP